MPTLGPKPESLRFLSRLQVRRLLEGPRGCGASRDFYLLAISYFCALRGAEAVCMRSPLIRSEYGEVLVPSAKRKKARSGETLDEYTKRPLIRIPILHGDKILAAAAEWSKDRVWMFPSPSKDGPISTRQYRHTFNRWAKVAKLDQRVSAHSLRHSAGTHVQDAMIESGHGEDLVLVRDFMRHTDLATTSIYMHSTPAKIRRARDAMRRYRG